MGMSFHTSDYSKNILTQINIYGISYMVKLQSLYNTMNMQSGVDLIKFILIIIIELKSME